ncbi:MAG: type II CAAX endopeptidase family protein [Anaerolineae bacterium]|jgi:membrane protease YdiL (CAAX protease family)
MPNDKGTNARPAAFFALTYGLSWLFWIPAALSGQDVMTTAWLALFMLGGFGPSVAGIIMVYRRKGKEGRRDFWRRVIDLKRISAAWHLFIFLIFPALFAISFLLNSLLGNPLPELETLARVAAQPLMVVGMVVSGIITGPLSEELGWRGFALDEMQKKWSPLVSSLIIAPFWWGWHLPLFFMRGTTQYAWGLGAPFFWLFLVQIVPLSILLTWVYNRNGRSTLAAILLHFTFNFTFGLASPIPVTVYFIQVALLYITAVAVVLIDRSRP